MFLKSLHKTPSGILVDRGILEEMLSAHLAVHKAGGRDEFDIYLNALSGMIHLLVGLRNILRIGRMDSHDALLFEKTVESWDGAGITALHKLDPENDKPCVRVSSAHIGDEFDLLRGMLVRVVMWPSGTVAKRLDRAVKAAFPAIDVLAVGFILDGSISNPIFVSIFNKR